MSRSLALVVSTLALAGCGPQQPTGTAKQALIGNAKFASLSVAGALNYGNTSSAVAYTSTPTYRAFSFTGAAGDQVDARVSAPDGDAIGWLIDASYHIVAANDDDSDATTDSHMTATLAAGGTFYVIFRELDLKPATLTVTLACAGGTCSGVCTPGALRCSGNQPQVCSPSGQWSNQGGACANACLGGACVDCAPGSVQCSGLVPQTCSANGQWVSGTTCTYACGNGVCGSCVPGSTECLGNGIGVCDGGGNWVVSQTCPSGWGCANASCVCQQPSPSCDNNACGVHSNSCGQSLDCGDCADPNAVCTKGYCKTVHQPCPCGGTIGHCRICN